MYGHILGAAFVIGVEIHWVGHTIPITIRQVGGVSLGGGRRSRVQGGAGVDGADTEMLGLELAWGEAEVEQQHENGYSS
ncbi:MAG: hypothetical protein HC904_12520 [Blastochloris sp.]|nr:hypothetical protein [Blastochloris sp.]